MKYYCIRQHDMTDCGAACLATISKQYGLNLSLAKVRLAAGTDKQGTNVYGMIQAAEQLGFSAKGVKGNKEALFSDFPLPCIAHVIVDGTILHYVVIHKVTKNKVVIADPAKGVLELSPSAFLGEESIGGQAPEYKWSGVIIIMVPTADIKANEEKKGLFQRFLHILTAQKKLIIHIFAASLLYTILGIAGAFYFKLLIDSVLPDGLTRTLAVLSLGVILLNVFKVLLNAFRNHLLLYLSQKLDIALLLGYYRHVMALPMNFFGTRNIGEIISRFQDAAHVRDAISGAVLTMMVDTFMAVAGALVLYMQNARMFGMACMMVMLYGFIVIGFNKWYDKLNRKQMEANAQLTSYLVESLSGIETIKAYNAERKANQETEIKFVRLLKHVFRLTSVENAQNSLKVLVELIGSVMILWAGGTFVIQGTMTIGQLITFHSLFVYFLEPVKNLVGLQSQMQTAVVAAERLGEILDLAAEKEAGEQRKLRPDSIAGDICFEQVDFRYGTRKLTLEKVDFTIKKGQKAAFVGESGSGKTTLSKLLLHLYQVESGNIYLDENNLEDIQMETLRDKIAYIPQETFLFSGSIFDNLALGLDYATLDDMIEACKKAQAHAFINEMPLRYDTWLEENGSNLSGGQRQRLAIARAMLKQPDILILDEATSNLDSITENILNKTMREFSKDMTTIFIAHRLSTIKHCDVIFVMEKGKIVESGHHDELLQLNGKYAELVKHQSLESEG